jgi:hypothetical protein
LKISGPVIEAFAAVIRASRFQQFNDFAWPSHFPCNLPPDFLQYTIERPEVTSHEGAKEGQNMKGEILCNRNPRLNLASSIRATTLLCSSV